MKVECKPRSHDVQQAARTDLPGKTLLWTKALPFNVNPRGVLIHRVRSAKTHIWGGERRHDSLDYWCCASAVGEGIALTDDPPKDRLLCVHCETKAIAHGEPSAEALTGRHVCIGEMRAHRLCCHNEQN